MDNLLENGHLTEDALNQYLEKQLSQFNRRRIERHLLKCPLCFKRLETLKEKLDDKDSDNGESSREAA